MFVESPPYPGSENIEPYEAEIPANYWPEYQRYLALVYSYDGYRKFPGQSAMALYGDFRERYEEGRPLGGLPDDPDLLRMLLFVAERNARHQGWYEDSHKRFVTAIMEKLKEKVASREFG